MKIRNKLESIEIINKLGLNRFPEELFRLGEYQKVEKFLKSYPTHYYAIRDKSKSGGVFKLKVEYNNVLKEITKYSLFLINVSSANYADSQLLVGEIEILSNGNIYATLSTDSTASVRDALKNPTFNLKTNIFNKKIDNIPYFDFIYQYIVNHNLQDTIVEFALFNKNIGICNDRIIIYELRTDY